MFSFTSIADYHQGLKQGVVTCVEAVQHYIQEIEASDSLNAYIEVFGDEAFKRARDLDSLDLTGRLHGVVVGLKDNICFKDHTITAGSKMLGRFQSLFSATAVERLLEEGAIIIGRHNCDEFGMGSTNENSHYGAVSNPLNHDHVPGGSSGGSAAAVKAGLCMAALGSDTGGSVRLPADFCGVVGMKPSYGAVSRHGLIAYASSFDQIGVLANNVDDAALILDIISGPDKYDSTANRKDERGTDSSGPVPSSNPNQPYRIAWFPEWIEHSSIDPEISSSLKNLLQQLKEAGHQVEPVPFPFTDYIVPSYYVLTTAEASSNLARYDGIRYGYRSEKPTAHLQELYKHNRAEGFGMEVKRRIMLGSFVLSTGYFDAYYTKAQQVRRRLKDTTDLIFKDFDFIIAPNSPTVALKKGAVNQDPVAMYLGDIFTVFANLVGIPAISLPIFKHSSNLPFGVQVLSSGGNEVSLLSFSHHLMQQ